MIFVKVKLYGTLRRFSQPETPGFWQGEITNNSNIADVIQIIGSTVEEVAGATINGEFVSFDSEVPDGAEIKLVTPIGGG